MALASAKLHSWQCRASVGVQTPAAVHAQPPVNEKMASALVNEFMASARVIEDVCNCSCDYSVQVLQVQIAQKTIGTLAPVIEFVAPTMQHQRQ